MWRLGPPGGIHRTPWGAVGWVVRPFWARARALRLHVSFLRLARIWPDLAIFVETALFDMAALVSGLRINELDLRLGTPNNYKSLVRFGTVNENGLYKECTVLICQRGPRSGHRSKRVKHVISYKEDSDEFESDTSDESDSDDEVDDGSGEDESECDSECENESEGSDVSLDDSDSDDEVDDGFGEDKHATGHKWPHGFGQQVL